MRTLKQEIIDVINKGNYVDDWGIECDVVSSDSPAQQTRQDAQDMEFYFSRMAIIDAATEYCDGENPKNHPHFSADEIADAVIDHLLDD